MVSHDSLRSIFGTLLLALYLPVPIYMTWIHAPHRLWKRIGPSSYAIHWFLYALMVVAIILLHGFWRWGAWAWPQLVSWTAIVPLALAAWLAYRTYAEIDPGTLLTFRQIRPGAERRLIHSGILGMIRHPRYVMFTLLAVGNVLVTGYPLVLASLVVTVVVFAAVIRLEEKEMLEYFGDEFEEYKRNVPAFIPRLRRRDGT